MFAQAVDLTPRQEAWIQLRDSAGLSPASPLPLTPSGAASACVLTYSLEHQYMPPAGKAPNALLRGAVRTVGADAVEFQQVAADVEAETGLQFALHAVRYTLVEVHDLSAL